MKYTELYIFISLPLAIFLFFSNCSEVEFAQVSEVQKVTETEVGIEPVYVNEPPGEEVICGGAALGNESCEENIEKGNGLIGGLYYYPNEYDNTKISHKVDSLIEHEFTHAGSIYFNQVFVPTFNFSLGFPTQNGLLKKPNGEILDEGFALDLYTKFVLRTDQEEGNYQFALLSDDGSKLLNLDSGELLVNNDGEHSTQMKCGATILLEKNKPINLRLRYYQGPRTSVALTMLIRKVSSSNSSIHCNQKSDHEFFYSSGDDKNNNVTPNLEDFWFGDLIDAGWVVPTVDNYKLP
ncbi:MAG: hypothetical protein KDD58_11660 [Bdellovibrionales bacterium]|nr:hypothetical protein [Bdellovibrionales bacterium]